MLDYEEVRLLGFLAILRMHHNIVELTMFQCAAFLHLVHLLSG